MSCPDRKRIDGRDWPLSSQPNEELCAYDIETASSDDTASIAAKAAAMPGYVEKSQFFEVPAGVSVIVYFKSAN